MRSAELLHHSFLSPLSSPDLSLSRSFYLVLLIVQTYYFSLHPLRLVSYSFNQLVLWLDLVSCV